MPLRFRLSASDLPPSSAPTSVRSCAAAVSNSLFTDSTTLSISIWSFASADWMAERTFTISGCRSPYLSASCGLLTLQIAQVALQLLDVVVAEHRRERVDRVAVLNRPQLVVERLLFDARRLGLGGGAVEIGQPLHDDVLSVLDGDGVVLLLVALQLGLARLDLLPLLGQLLLEPVGGVLRGGEAILEVLLDVGPRVRVGQVGRQLRIRGRHADVDQPAVADGRDAERAKHHAGVSARTGRCLSGESARAPRSCRRCLPPRTWRAPMCP